MSRKRFITSEMSNDERVAAVAEEDQTAALMWPWFIKELDDWARMSANPRELKLKAFQAFNFSSQELQSAMELCVKHGLAHLYTVDGKQYLQANPEAFYKLQTYIQKARQVHDASKYPPPGDHPWGRYWATSEWDIGKVQQSLANVADNQQALQLIVPSPSPSPINTGNNDFQTLAKALYDWLKAKDALPAQRGWFAKQMGIARNVLLQKRPLEEWLACFEWAKNEPYWSVNLDDLNQLGGKAWTQYARKRPPVAPPAESVVPPESEAVRLRREARERGDI